MNCTSPPVAECLSLGETGVLIPIRIEVSDVAVGFREPHNLGREIEEIFESASGCSCPPFELSSRKRDGEKRNAGNADYQPKLIGSEDEIVIGSPITGPGSEFGSRHSGVVHPGNRQSQEQRRSRLPSPYARFRPSVDQIAGQRECRERQYDSDSDRYGDEKRIVDDLPTHSHSGHAGVVHAGDCSSDENAGNCQQWPADSSSIEDDEGDRASAYRCDDRGEQG